MYRGMWMSSRVCLLRPSREMLGSTHRMGGVTQGLSVAWVIQLGVRAGWVFKAWPHGRAPWCVVPELSLLLFHDCFLSGDPGRELPSQSPLIRRRLGTWSSPVPLPGHTASDHQGDWDQLCGRGGNNRRAPAFTC